MTTPLVDLVKQYVLPHDNEDDGGPTPDEGVQGNARLTGALGALLLVGLFVEGLTLLMGARENLVLHVFVGFLVLPAIVVKLGSTGWRMARYYLKNARYQRKGPPPLVLRVLGPLVILSTIALFGTGIAMIALGDSGSWHLGQLHKLSFIAWFGLMTIHVLGHLIETGRLARGDWLPRQPRVSGAPIRRLVVVGSVVAGLLLGALSVSWSHSYDSGREHGRRELKGDDN